ERHWHVRRRRPRVENRMGRGPGHAETARTVGACHQPFPVVRAMDHDSADEHQSDGEKGGSHEQQAPPSCDGAPHRCLLPTEDCFESVSTSSRAATVAALFAGLMLKKRIIEVA